MEEEKSKVEDVLELFLEIFEPADIFGNFFTNIFKSSNVTGKKDIKTFQDLISFCGKLDTSKRTAKQQTDSEAIWRTRCVEYVDAVLALRLETRTLGWRALLKILNYLHNYGPQKQEYLRECKRILDYLISSNVNCRRESDRDYNVTLFCLNLLECDSSIPISHGELSVALFRDIFKICHRVAFTHSSGTLTAFKCLEILVEIARKCLVCSDDICSEICYKNELFDIIMANWENPVPAVRKLVEKLLRAWIKCDENCYRNWPMKCGCSVNCQSDLLKT
ncbi:uncharacterized protein LOC111055896 isoform X1 [Nilaparvata lugens]|uniref:uncharacterized protein LOC111055896 isoform X1 n=1 Tax=Nilaparvata lugens TaxID=108931 RepID=UPI00193EB0BD|nr:uncharacterized protein LOC111055896 isoform X1 [Nilaparvata lugens]